MTRLLLDMDAVEVRFGPRTALHGVGLQLGHGQAAAVLGANGAGKSTLMRAIMGLIRPHAGRIRFDGAPIDAQSTEQRARLGIGYCPEGRRVFPGLTVLENLQVASWESRAARRQRLDEVFDLFAALAVRQGSLAWQLSGGQQQMLAIGRSLMNRPRLLLLDEPCLGLSPKLSAELLGRLGAIVAGGTAVLLAEQSPARASAVCDTAIVLKNGRIVASGAAADLVGSAAMTAAVLGT